MDGEDQLGVTKSSLVFIKSLLLISTETPVIVCRFTITSRISK